MATDQPTQRTPEQPIQEQQEMPAAVEHAPTPPEQGQQLQTPDQAVHIEGIKQMEEIRMEEQGGISEAIDTLTQKLRRSKKKQTSATTIPAVRDELTKEVEHIMEDGLKDAFRELSPTEAQAFKIKGEETAREIRQLLKGTKVKIKAIFELLFAWLKLLPGVNIFFLEQEAKIKADKIMTLHRKQMSERTMNITNK